MPIAFDPALRLPDKDIDSREATCRSVLASAAEIAMQGFEAMRRGAPVEMKGPQDFLTRFDALVEMHIRDRLADAFPEDGFLGEESDARLAPRLWVVDPIDGTANFARGIGHFAVSIAFVDQGKVVLGAIASPATNETWFARSGRGAECNGEPIRVAGTTGMERASVELGWSNRVANHIYVERLNRLLDLGANVRRGASGALGLAYVANGRSDAYGELHINAWDCLAGLLIAHEAGARTNAFLAGDGLLKGNPVLAAAPGVAEAVSAAMGIALAEPGEEVLTAP